ncbi:hypothetical protein VIN30_03760 [Adlercreutzia sp. R7]|uniref:Uncharacterized protein n=1 Tax=Adlercreutzia wanghongyangiae TaxID=3111451 RepID=A0ABU6IGI7_9ACTN|nr:hypothetical protein [Adlercreutzia sp. R7]
MFPIFDINGIESSLRGRRDRRAILLLLVKPSDEMADSLIQKFNYYHFDSAEACSIFAAGFSEGCFSNEYEDAYEVCSVCGRSWWYSDQCFVGLKKQLEARLKWRYSGEIEILILQRSMGEHSSLDFTNYVSIDALAGIREGYIDSLPRLMESLINASKVEVESKRVLDQAKRLSPKEIAQEAIKTTLEAIGCPERLRQALSNSAFYRSAKRKG